MSIKFKIICYFSLQTLLLAILFVSLWWMIDSAQRLSELQLRRYESRELAQELRQSSDDLTRMARTYVVTGDARYLDHFNQIIAIRNGEAPRPKNYENIYWDYVTADTDPRQEMGRGVSLVDLMKEQQFTSDELALLTEAKEHSDNLTALETRAFMAMQGRFLAEDGSFSRTSTPNRQLALKLLHCDEYHQAKASIMADIDTVFKKLDIRTLREVERAEKNQQHPLLLAIILSVILIGMNIIGYTLFHSDINRPLQRLLNWILSMPAGNYRFDVSGYRKDEIGTLARSFADMAHQVEEHIHSLEKLSSTDPLTQVTNRIALDRMLYNEKYKFERYAAPCSVILLDIDHFKAVNDRFGHMAGDRVLIEVARLLTTSTRESDLVGRWGGEEFMIICPNTDKHGARELAELIRKRVDVQDFEEVGHITTSLGVSEFIRGATIESIINTADEALYEAKRSGRNQVC